MSAAGETVAIALTVNGRAVAREVAARTTLADLLRTELGLTGTNLGCEQGICGACTVLVDREPVRACLLYAWQVDRSEVVSIEGADAVAEVACARNQVAAHQAFQCGFCTPGFVMLIGGQLLADPAADDEQLAEALSANICRCTGYRDLLAAARAAREDLGA